jgi:hypothetical protein
MSKEPRVEWVGALDMAEVAEAVKTTSDLVMAVHSGGIVMYTPEGTEEIWVARLDRDADNILVAGPGRFWITFAQFEKEMQEGLDAKFRQMEADGELPPRLDE